jgi:hypothetical protein
MASGGGGCSLSYIPLSSPNYTERLTPLRQFNGRKRWRDDESKRIFEYDSQHGELEVYNKRGRHLGVADVESGQLIKPAIKDRRISDV